MRRLSAQKGKRGKNAASKESSNEPESTSDVETQGNGKPALSDDEESLSEKKTAQNSRKKNKRGRKNAEEKVLQKTDAGDDDSDVPVNPKKKKSGKKGRKGNESESDEEKYKSDENNDVTGKVDEEYEVEKIIDCRLQGGIKQYRIRWKGYEEDRDTWEPEADLNCSDLIEGFLEQHPDAFKKTAKVTVKSEKSAKKTDKKRKKSTDPPSSKKKKQRDVEPVSEEGGEKVYEVDKVVEVHFKKNGEREFLIRWKGFTSDDDTWEPESNLDCTELISKFMERVKKAKELGMRELRANPQVTNRFTLNTHDSGRRLSSRNTGRQRTTYYNTE